MYVKTLQCDLCAKCEATLLLNSAVCLCDSKLSPHNSFVTLEYQFTAFYKHTSQSSGHSPIKVFYVSIGDRDKENNSLFNLVVKLIHFMKSVIYQSQNLFCSYEVKDENPLTDTA